MVEEEIELVHVEDDRLVVGRAGVEESRDEGVGLGSGIVVVVVVVVPTA